MKKEEFLQGLGEALAGEMPTETVKENLRYYEDYIRTEQGRGDHGGAGKPAADCPDDY